jgi:hypothetical protein
MHDIALYGHLVADVIDFGSKKEFNFGGIGNVWRSLKYIDATLDVCIHPLNMGSSYINVDTKTSTRTSRSQLNQLSITPQIVSAKIYHICYINELDDLSFIKDLNGIVCADICTGRSLNNECLKYIDYLFISKEDLNHIDRSMVKNSLIIHSPTESSLVKNNNVISVDGEFISGLNVLGAGDHFAASFMHSLLNNHTDAACLTQAHHQTTMYLRERNDKT